MPLFRPLPLDKRALDYAEGRPRRRRERGWDRGGYNAQGNKRRDERCGIKRLFSPDVPCKGGGNETSDRLSVNIGPIRCSSSSFPPPQSPCPPLERKVCPLFSAKLLPVASSIPPSLFVVIRNLRPTERPFSRQRPRARGYLRSLGHHNRLRAYVKKAARQPGKEQVNHSAACFRLHPHCAIIQWKRGKFVWELLPRCFY